MTHSWPLVRPSTPPRTRNSPSVSGRSGGPIPLPLGCPTYSEENVIGQRFGQLTVLEQVPVDRYARFRCQCDCGQRKVVRAAHLRAGGTRSCGCGQQRSIEAGAKTAIDMVGQVVGRLTVLARAGSQQLYGNMSQALFLCRCRCGKELVLPGERLRRRNGTRSCGCLRRDSAATI
jgi:hypothetical protein